MKKLLTLVLALAMTLSLAACGGDNQAADSGNSGDAGSGEATKMTLTLRGGEAPLEGLDLSAVAELKVTDKGGVEIKLIDRIRALEVLCGLLSEEKAEGAGELYRVLADAAGEEGAWDDG